jgi:hypothetical protein
LPGKTKGLALAGFDQPETAAGGGRDRGWAAAVPGKCSVPVIGVPAKVTDVKISCQRLFDGRTSAAARAICSPVAAA